MSRAVRFVCVLLAAWTVSSSAAGPQLTYVAILTRHGVRAPTWEPDRLKQYSAEAWPDFGVPPGHLTPRGRALMTLMGGYYGEWLVGERLLERGCASASSVYIWADTDQRTLETGRALAGGLLRRCPIRVHSLAEGQDDPLFNPLATPAPAPDLGPAARARQPAFRMLNQILGGGRPVTPVDTLNTASTMTENLLLEYANGFEGKDLGWGRLTANNLLEVMELHTAYADLTRRAPELARARGGNLLSHVLASMAQAATGKAAADALGGVGSRVLVISGHDTNISNVSGMLQMSWHLPGYQPDDVPPGGAIVFTLWRGADGGMTVRARHVAQTLEQMRAQARLTVSAPPASQAVAIAGCRETATDTGCPWPSFERAVRRAIRP